MASENLDIIVKLVDEATQKLKQIKDEISLTGEKAKETNKKFSDFMSSARTGLATLGTITSGATALIIGNIVKQASAFEQSTIAFQTMLGSAEAGSKMLADLSQFAAKTPFTLPGIESAAKQLLAMGISTENLLPTLKSLGDVSAGLSVPIEQIGLAYGQVRTANQLYGTELRQFVSAGVPLLAELASMYGKTEAEVKKMVEESKVGFSDVEQAFKNMSGEGGIFFNLMDKQSKTLGGLLSSLSDQFTLLARSIGAPIIEAVKPAIEELISLISRLTTKINEGGIVKFFEENRTAILLFSSAIGTVLIGALAAMIAAFVSFAGPAILVSGLLAIIGVQLAFVMKKFIDVIPVVVGLWNGFIDTLVTLKNYFAVVLKEGDYLNDWLTHLPEFLQNVVSAIGEFVTNTLQLWQNLKDGIINKITEVKNISVALWQSFVEALKAVWSGITAFFTMIWNGIVTIFQFWVSLLIGLVIVAFEAMGINIIEVFKQVQEGIINIWTSITQWVITNVQAFSEWWKTTWEEVSFWFSNLWNETSNIVSVFVDSIMEKVNSFLESVRATWTEVWSFIATFAMTKWNELKKNFTDSTNAISSVFSPWVSYLGTVWSTMWTGMTLAASSAWEVVKLIVKSSINWIIEKVNTLINAINTVTSKGAGLLKITVPQISNIPMLANGGNITQSGSAIVGENGPELLHLPRGAQVQPLGRQGVTINIYNTTVLDNDDVTTKIGDPIIQYLKLHGAIL